MIGRMPGTNLTRDEAASRADLLDVASATVELDLTVGDAMFASTTVLRFTCAEPGATTFADLVGGTDVRVELNGTELDASAVYRDSRIELAGLAADNELRVSALLPYSHTGEGLHRFVDPADGRVYLYSQFEVPDARRVYTTFEQPDLKTVFTFTVTAPEDWKVVSNAVTPEPERTGDGSGVWRFPVTERMSTYITALVAGEYVEVRDTYVGAHGEIDLGLYCRASVEPYLDRDELFELTKQGFAFYEEKFDFPYPFGKYDQLFVPEYNMGAMENAGCVTYRDEYLPRSRQTHSFYEQRANTVLHEMAHMWFGDLVTMRWWDDLWLNESFAEWASHHALVEATKYVDAWTGFTNARKNWAYRQDQLPSTHPIAADNHDLEAVEVNFDGITYAKGASTLKQLVAWVGIDEFLAGLRAYFKAHAFGNSTFADLLASLEKASGRELAGWAQEWLQTSGVNTLAPAIETDADGVITSFAVLQSAAPDYPTLRRHRLGIGLYDLVDGRLVRRAGEEGYVETDVRGERTVVTELAGVRRPALLLLNDGDLTYAKIRLDDVSLATAVAHVDTLDDTLVRALLWGATWDMTRDAEMRAADFVELVLRGLATETDMTAVGRLPTYAGQAVAYYTAPAGRAAVRARWESGLRELLENAEPGSDAQLALTRAFAAAAHTDEAVDLVAAILDGSVVIEGLDVDTDVRWALVASLAAAGRAEEDRIAEELERDTTISGQERAAAARTARPTAEAKAAAWRDAVERDDVANETQRQVAYSFCRSDQAEVLAPYLEKYLATAETIWEEKGTQRASTVLVGMFPLPLTSPETLARVDEWILTSEANPAAKRYVGEGRSDMARALAAQERDAG